MGHISPSIAFSKKAQERGYNVTLVCTTKDTKFKLEERTSSKIYYIDAFGFTTNPFLLIKRIIKNKQAIKKIKNIIKYHNANVAIGFGGYISGLGIIASNSKGLKCFIHEQNPFMGLANKLVYKKCEKIFLSFNLKNTIKRANFILIGNPVYDEAYRLKKLYVKKRNTILFTSGSLGSEFINNLAIEYINSCKDYEIYVVTGSRYYEDFVRRIIKGNNVHVISYTNNLLELMCISKVVVTRAGASTLYEILATSCYPIIIPSPNVTNNHQLINAIEYTKMYDGVLLKEEDASLSVLTSLINEHINNCTNLSINNLDVCNKMIKEIE